MLFNSIDFLIFLPIVLSIFYMLPHRRRWILLLLASYVFYAGWKVEYLFLILFSTIVDYSLAIGIHRSQGNRGRKLLLGLSLLSNFGLLILFKYFHFLIGGSSWFKSMAESNESVLWLQFIFNYGIPVGISFYTFQTVSYVVDVYKKRIEPERNLAKFGLFVSFFPQLVAGPIERFSSLHHQLFSNAQINLETIRRSFQLMLYGFFLKMVVADNIGDMIISVFDTPETYTVISRISAVILFSWQIFADFFGYTLIAIGTAQLFGVKLQDNFKSPYGSYSIREFWTRWHISLSQWFRDYVYIPLGGSKSTKWKWIMAIILTFGLSGLWHGADVSFIYWGLIHAILYLIEQLFFPSHRRTIIRWFITYAAVTFAWLFFRADSMDVVGRFFNGNIDASQNISIDLNKAIPLIAFLILEVVFRNERIDRFLHGQATHIRWIMYSLLILLISLFSSTGHMQFIYFQF